MIARIYATLIAIGALVALAASGASLAFVVRTIEVQGTAPPPYTDPNIATTNALGGVGRTVGWTFADTQLVTNLWDTAPQAVQDLIFNGPTMSVTRFITVKLISVSGAAATDMQCLQLGTPSGQEADVTGFSCDANNVSSTKGNGGCALVNVGDLCQWTVRPINDCDGADVPSCQIPILIRTTAGSTGTFTVQTAVAW